jgi:hypothetical protein
MEPRSDRDLAAKNYYRVTKIRPPLSRESGHGV